MNKIKVNGRAVSMPAGLAVGALVSMAITIMIAGIGAYMIMSEVLAQEQIGYCSIAALLCGTISGCITSYKRVKHRRLLVCLLSGLIYFCSLLCLTATFFGGQYKGFGVTFVTVMLGSLASVMLTGREGSNKSGIKRKKYWR